jgi:hypothetical protein
VFAFSIVTGEEFEIAAGGLVAGGGGERRHDLVAGGGGKGAICGTTRAVDLGPQTSIDNLQPVQVPELTQWIGASVSRQAVSAPAVTSHSRMVLSWEPEARRPSGQSVAVRTQSQLHLRIAEI